MESLLMCVTRYTVNKDGPGMTAIVEWSDKHGR